MKSLKALVAVSAFGILATAAFAQDAKEAKHADHSKIARKPSNLPKVSWSCKQYGSTPEDLASALNERDRFRDEAYDKDPNGLAQVMGFEIRDNKDGVLFCIRK